jgi:hypothetical protein
MKPISLLLIPCVAILLSACAGPAGPGYGYGPGPNPRPGYYWNGTVYVQGSAPYDRSAQYSRNVTDVNDVNVNRTNINDRTVNNTSVNNTNVHDRTVNGTNVDKTTLKKAKAKHKKPLKPAEQNQATPKSSPAQ